MTRSSKQVLGIYTRVSTDDQLQNGQSLETQSSNGKDLALRYQFDFKIYSDGGLSGSLPYTQRPALKKLVDDICDNKVHGLFVSDLSRLSRGDSFHTQILKKIILDNKCRLFTGQGEINLEDEGQELSMDIQTLMNAFYLKQTSTSIKKNLRKSANDGKAGGGPLLNYGYTKDANKKLILEREEAKVVKKIYTLCIQGKGTRVIAKLLNEKGIPTKRNQSEKGQMEVRGEVKTSFVWRDAVIYRILTNPIYKGERLFKGKIVDTRPPAIVSPEVFDTVQQVLRERKNNKDTTNKYFYLLKGLIKCGNCGHSFYGRKREDLSDNQYVCGSQRNGPFCGTRGINIDYLNDLIWKSITTIHSDVRTFYVDIENEQSFKYNKSSLKKLYSEKKAIEGKINNLLSAVANVEVNKDLFETKMKELNQELKNTEEQASRIVKSMQILQNRDEVLQLIYDLTFGLRGKKIAEDRQRQILLGLIDGVSILWNNTSQQHTILVDYKIDKLTELRLGTDIQINYSKQGWRLDKQDYIKSGIRIRRIYSDVLNMNEKSGTAGITYI